MKLTEAREKFNRLRSDERRVYVGRHVREDHPERGFTDEEVRGLISTANARLFLNQYPSAIEGSWLVRCRDGHDRACEFAIVFKNAPTGDELIIVKHAYR